MLEQLIERILPTIIAALELMGIFIVAVSALSAFGRYLKSLFTRTPVSYTHLTLPTNSRV